MKFVFLYIVIATTIGLQAQIDRSKMPILGPTPTVDLTPPPYFQLPNGLTVFVVEKHKLPKVTISLSIENPPLSENNKVGVTRVLSKVMGKGTATIPKAEFYEEVDFLGAVLNVGIYGGFAQSLSKHKNRIFELFASALLQPNFTEEELALEKKKIKEHLKNEENNSGAIMRRLSSLLMYGRKHPFGEYMTPETISNISLTDLKTIYEQRCVPNHAYMVISGDITMEEAKALVKQHFQDWKAQKLPSKMYPKVVNVPQRQINLIDMPDAVQTEIVVANTAMLKMNSKDHHAALLANYILGGGFSSYINMNLREQHAFTYGARSMFSRNRYDKSVFKIKTKVRNAVTDSAVLEILNEVKRIRNTLVTDEVLKNAKAQFLGSFIRASENDKTMAARSIKLRTEDLPADFYTTFIAKINAVTPEEVQRVAQHYFKIDNFRIILVGKTLEILPKIERLTFEGKAIPIVHIDTQGNVIQKESH